MAKDEKSMLVRMNKGELAKPGATPPAIRQPRDPSQKIARSETGGVKGKSPDEVLGERAERQPETPAQVVEGEEQPVKKYKVEGKELTLDEIAAQGYMETLLTQSEQYKYLNRKHTEVLEGLAEKVLAAPDKAKEVQPPAPKIPPTQILNHYMPMAQATAQEGYIEPDLLDAYPLMMTGLMHYRTIIEEQEVKIQNILTWISEEIKIRNRREALMRLNSAVDAVAAQDGKLFELLRNKDVRDKFITFVRKEVDPNVSDLTKERMNSYYITFQSDFLLEMAKGAEGEQPKPRRNTRGDGSSSAPGAPEGFVEPPTMLSRMSALRLGPEQ